MDPHENPSALVQTDNVQQYLHSWQFTLSLLKNEFKRQATILLIAKTWCNIYRGHHLFCIVQQSHLSPTPGSPGDTVLHHSHEFCGKCSGQVPSNYPETPLYVSKSIEIFQASEIINMKRMNQLQNLNWTKCLSEPKFGMDK